MRPIRNCLNEQLTKLCKHSLQLEHLSHQVMQFLPEELAPYCQVGSFNKGCLILTVVDANWASQLRFALPELRDRLRKEAQMYQLSSIKITVGQPKAPAIKPKSKPLPLLSAKAKEIILQDSQRVSYEPLKQALMRLSDS